MNKLSKAIAYFLAALTITMALASGAAKAAPEIGKPAPDFTATAIDGQPFKLSDHKGKNIVLEWSNHECPFVVKHYSTGNMQKTQEAAKSEGALWVTIVSSAPGKQGHTTPEESKKIMDEAGAKPDFKILDETGEIGKLYNAQTTPHMFVIGADGNLAYMGAIDDNSSPKPDTVEGAHNYVLSALSDLKAGKPVETPQTQPYGCAVKYGD